MRKTSTAAGPLHAHYVWSPVYVNAMVLRDFNFTGAGSFALNERTYATQDANFNVTSLISLASTLGDDNGDGSVIYVMQDANFNVTGIVDCMTL